ncbi:hypothetical protein GCM10022254_39670 [Actinomadura meridiana]|uniref:Uncharacterized protein n=2 Tax=Actinomadura meridiana TaxID=559626 RepID=A0ABP8C6E7_9ACTN
MVAVTLLGWRGRVIDAIPPEVRSGLVLSVAVFIGMAGLKLAGVAGDGASYPHSLVAREAAALYLGFGLAWSLSRRAPRRRAGRDRRRGRVLPVGRRSSAGHSTG